MQYIVYHKNIDCRSVVFGCRYLKVGTSIMTERIKMITCTALHTVLQFQSKKIKGSINEEIDIIETPWECPHLVNMRKKGLLSSVQASIIP